MQLSVLRTTYGVLMGHVCPLIRDVMDSLTAQMGVMNQ